MRERRRDPRFNLRGQVSLSFEGNTQILPVADISVSGIALTLSRATVLRALPGVVGMCRIESEDLAHPVEAFVSVMSTRRSGQEIMVGLRFESISDQDLGIVRAYEALYRARQRRLLMQQARL